MALDPWAFAEPPPEAAWRHRGARTGFEVVYAQRTQDGYLFEGHVTAVENGRTWAVDYDIRLDREWVTLGAAVRSRSASGARSTVLAVTSEGRWTVNGASAPELDGCRDVDLEASAFTNALPVHRIRLAPGDRADAPAVYVRALDGVVERLEQTYLRLGDGNAAWRCRYSAPAFDFTCDLTYDQAGLLLDYPGIAVRAA
jgi:hypothetical protein